MKEQGIDWLGAEYKRTDQDFTFCHLQQDNCCCSICHGTGARWEFGYVTRNYRSPRTKKICESLQAHGHSFWICPTCLENMKAITGIAIMEERKEERKKAKLLNANPVGECSACGWLIDYRDEFNFCPKCGKRLEEEEKKNEERSDH